MQIGDHLVTPRIGYTHHGIFVGDDSVVHYSGFANSISSGLIEVTSLKAFCNGKSVKVRTYKKRKYSRKECVARAYSRLGEDWYNVLLNNCEQFVVWCITGKHASEQVNNALMVGITGVTAKHLSQRVAASVICDQAGLAGARLLVGQAANAGMASSAMGIGSGVATGVGMSSASTAAVGIAGLAAGSALTAVAVPVAVGTVVGFGIKKLVDWIED